MYNTEAEKILKLPDRRASALYVAQGTRVCCYSLPAALTTLH